MGCYAQGGVWEFLAQKQYEEIKDYGSLTKKMNTALEDYNVSQHKKPLNLVMFMYAIEHVSRIFRVLAMPRGNLLLVGVGGSGRQSLTYLSAYMGGLKVVQIEVSQKYGVEDWKEDLKETIREAQSRRVVFLLSDAQIKMEVFLEDINSLLNSGEVPNLFAADELAEFDDDIVIKTKENLHIVLAFSPIGAAFRDRLRKFPSLISSCAIDWFSAWPQDALRAVAGKFLSDVDTDHRDKCVQICLQFHMHAKELWLRSSSNCADTLMSRLHLTLNSFTFLRSFSALNKRR